MANIESPIIILHLFNNINSINPIEHYMYVKKIHILIFLY